MVAPKYQLGCHRAQRLKSLCERAPIRDSCLKVRISNIRSFFGTPKITSIIPVIVAFLEESNFAAELMRRYSNFSVKERLNRLNLPGER
jgi:hypothetical protein